MINTEEYEKVKKGFQGTVATQILFDIHRSVEGTEIAVQLLQNLQSKHKISAFGWSKKLLLFGRKIQALKIDKGFMYDPDVKFALEIEDK